MLVAALVCSGAAACGDDGNPPVDADPGSCDGKVAITGEVVDWDANRTTFCGVFNATLTVRGTPALTDVTNPNGRFEMCIPDQAVTVIDVAYGAAPSECTIPKDSYPVAGVIVVDKGSGNAIPQISARAMTAMRQAEMFTAVGAAYDASKAQLVVHVDGTATMVTTSASHAAAQRFDGTSWGPGAAGSDVFLPNVAPGVTTVTVGSTTYSLTLAAGVFTYLSSISAQSAR